MRENLVGEVFGRLTVICRDSKQTTKTRWICKCICGVTKSVAAGNLKNTHTKSCGCLKREFPNGTTHGQCHTRTFRIYRAMLTRCNNTNSAVYKNYGGRGIKVCKRWSTFEVFFSDMGECPENLCIERTNNNKGYSPSNCAWASRHQQSLNKRPNSDTTKYEYKGRQMTIRELSKLANLSLGVIRYRFATGYTVEQTVTVPLHTRHTLSF